MTLLYAREKNSLTKEYEVINQEDAKAQGWAQYDVEFDMNTLKWYAAGYIPEFPAPTKEEIEAIRAELYRNEVDPLMAEYNRKKLFNLFDEGEEESLMKQIQDKVSEIKEANPYPAEEVSEAEEGKVEITNNADTPETSISAENDTIQENISDNNDIQGEAE